MLVTTNFFSPMFLTFDVFGLPEVFLFVVDAVCILLFVADAVGVFLLFVVDAVGVLFLFVAGAGCVFFIRI